jgi:hypothetical protein
MSFLPWIKLHVDIIANPKLYQLNESRRWRFVQLLALAGECNADGFLVISGVPLTPQYLGWRLLVDSKVIHRDLKALSRQGLVVLDEATGAWMIPGFTSRQARQGEGPRDYWREQKRRKRDTSQRAEVDDLEEEAFTQPGGPNLPMDLEEAHDEIEEADQCPPDGADPSKGKTDFEQEGDVPETFQENVPETVQGPFQDMFQENMLKRRIEDKRGEKKEKERRRGDRQRPPPSGRGIRPAYKGSSVFDEVERELAAKKKS